MFDYLTPKDFAQHYSGGRWKTAPHLDLINEYLVKLENREIEKLIINLPPRHGKTEFITKYFTAWYLLKNKSHKVLLTAYSDALSRNFSRTIFDIINSELPKLNSKIDPKSKSVSNFRILPEKGEFYATGSDGSLTGRGADLLIVDDPIKNAVDAKSLVWRDRLWDWFLSTAYTRLEPGGIIVIVMTRWHKDDLIGRIEEMGDLVLI